MSAGTVIWNAWRPDGHTGRLYLLYGGGDCFLEIQPEGYTSPEYWFHPVRIPGPSQTVTSATRKLQCLSHGWDCLNGHTYESLQSHQRVWALSTYHSFHGCNFPPETRDLIVHFLLDVAARSRLEMTTPQMLRFLGDSSSLRVEVRLPGVVLTEEEEEFLLYENLGDEEDEDDDGPYPAGREWVEGMVMFEVLESSSGIDCMICQDEMKAGDETGQMICKHTFHASCLREWLDLNGICPLCRFRLPGEGA